MFNPCNAFLRTIRKAFVASALQVKLSEFRHTGMKSHMVRCMIRVVHYAPSTHVQINIYFTFHMQKCSVLWCSAYCISSNILKRCARSHKLPFCSRRRRTHTAVHTIGMALHVNLRVIFVQEAHSLCVPMLILLSLLCPYYYHYHRCAGCMYTECVYLLLLAIFIIPNTSHMATWM